MGDRVSDDVLRAVASGRGESHPYARAEFFRRHEELARELLELRHPRPGAVLYEQLTVTTERYSLRATIIGWGHEDPRLVQPGPIGRTLSPRPTYTPDCVLRALADGWRLLGPPVHDDGEGWIWYLERAVRRG